MTTPGILFTHPDSPEAITALAELCALNRRLLLERRCYERHSLWCAEYPACACADGAATQLHVVL